MNDFRSKVFKISLFDFNFYGGMRSFAHAPLCSSCTNSRRSDLASSSPSRLDPSRSAAAASCFSGLVSSICTNRVRSQYTAFRLRPCPSYRVHTKSSVQAPASDPRSAPFPALLIAPRSGQGHNLTVEPSRPAAVGAVQLLGSFYALPELCDSLPQKLVFFLQ